MTRPDVVTREDWLKARTDLLTQEKALTRATDEVTLARRALPMVRITKEYAFEGPHGKQTLRDLFDDSEQLLVYHAMFDPKWDEACPGCSAGMDETSAPAMTANLKAKNTEYVRISRAPYDKIAKMAKQRGWTFKWVSSYGSDFNDDFGVTVDPTRGEPRYNYAPSPHTEPTELPGFSSFLREGDDVFHTYSAYARGTEPHGGIDHLLDLTVLGRQDGSRL
ncbi:DUF899 domain-containing protein [Tenggerimyces flavus]|uniref:DUF899 domain-containing protein n=1 Tax=Tenggerimyces flavus TaxID=1708749 RepID=A0ABV7Y6P4_9ACTN|nr:DUF899 domain-containing protein [Tenggerimyces flavus]MBM7791082.1 putative dithiol-disulfide oxidoreductase (DUF899 family) [Tenggerimyces flavus]